MNRKHAAIFARRALDKAARAREADDIAGFKEAIRQYESFKKLINNKK